MEVIKIKQIGGLKCDNPNCNYRDDSISVEDYPSYVNKPCPLCGCNLLTEADYKSFKKILKTVSLINRIYSFLARFSVKKNIQENSEAEMNINFNGTGKPDITVNEKK